MRNKPLNYVLIILGVFIIINLSRSILGLLKKGEVLTETKKKLSQAYEENKKLREDLQKVQSDAYVEKQAREKLNLGKSGEVVVIMPSILPKQKELVYDQTISNWQKWLAVFE